MASQAEKDTAAAKAKQGGGQAAKDTAAAKAKQGGGQAAIDTAAAKAKQNGGDGGTAADFADREAANGLTDTISAGRGGSGPSFADREAAAGLRNTTSGGVAMNATNPDFPPVGTPLGNDEFVATNNVGGGSGGELPLTPASEGLYVLANTVTIVDGVPTGQIAWSKTEEC